MDRAYSSVDLNIYDYFIFSVPILDPHCDTQNTNYLLNFPISREKSVQVSVLC